MASTAVKDVGSVFFNQTVASGSKGTQSGGDFLKVWSSQMSKGAAGDFVQDSKSQGKIQPQAKSGDSLNGHNNQVQNDTGTETENLQQADQKDKLPAGTTQDKEGTASETSDVQETSETELTEEQLQAMEVLGTAAVSFMEQIADTFGVSMEELQAAMEELGIGQADLLDASQLGALLLKLGGAADAYALITDEGLYGNYQALMEELQQVLQESAVELGMNPEQLPELLKESLEQAGALQEEMVPEEAVSGKGENLVEDMSPAESEAIMTVDVAAEAVEEEQPKQGGGQQEKNGRQTESGTDRGEQTTFFFQNLRTEQFGTGLQQTQEISQSPWSEDTRQIMDQIMNYMKLTLNADATSLEMQLHPASLGTLQIQIVSKGGMVTANFIAQNEAVKAAIESQMVQLQEQFEEQGVKVEAIEVTVQTHEFEQNLEQGRGRSQQEPDKKSRSRRVSLNGLTAAEDLEPEDETEARIAVGGSTVSYTA